MVSVSMKCTQKKVSALVVAGQLKAQVPYQQCSLSSLEKKCQASRDIAKYGGPWTAAELDENVRNLSGLALRQALVAQLKFQRDVLKAKGSRSLFYESTGGRPLARFIAVG
jgi:hypothetical protein